MSTVVRRPKGTPRRPQKIDPDILAAFEKISVLTPAEEELKRLLKLLLRREELELTPGAQLDPLVMRLAPRLQGVARADRPAILAEALLEQPEIDDLYVDDTDLGRFWDML